MFIQHGCTVDTLDRTLRFMLYSASVFPNQKEKNEVSLLLQGQSSFNKAKSAPELQNSSTACDHSAAGSAHAQSAGSTNSPRAITDSYQDKDPNFRVFTSSELRMATNDFNRPLKIEEGGFGSVDKGEINPREFDAQHHPIFVAVKKLKQDGFQGNKQWLAEVQFLGIVEHPNLVKLIGYCELDYKRGIRQLLFYEYMPNKCLADHLFRKA